jgi:hypothetical protein
VIFAAERNRLEIVSDLIEEPFKGWNILLAASVYKRITNVLSAVKSNAGTG